VVYAFQDWSQAHDRLGHGFMAWPPRNFYPPGHDPVATTGPDPEVVRFR
jgi:hypothetical protein